MPFHIPKNKISYSKNHSGVVGHALAVEVLNADCVSCSCMCCIGRRVPRASRSPASRSQARLEALDCDGAAHFALTRYVCIVVGSLLDDVDKRYLSAFCCCARNFASKTKPWLNSMASPRQQRDSVWQIKIHFYFRISISRVRQRLALALGLVRASHARPAAQQHPSLDNDDHVAAQRVARTAQSRRKCSCNVRSDVLCGGRKSRSTNWLEAGDGGDYQRTYCSALYASATRSAYTPHCKAAYTYNVRNGVAFGCRKQCSAGRCRHCCACSASGSQKKYCSHSCVFVHDDIRRCGVSVSSYPLRA